MGDEVSLSLITVIFSQCVFLISVDFPIDLVSKKVVQLTYIMVMHSCSDCFQRMVDELLKFCSMAVWVTVVEVVVRFSRFTCACCFDFWGQSG